MKGQVLALSVIALASSACEAVEVHYVGDDAGDARADRSPSFDAGPLNVLDANPIDPTGFCDCNLGTGGGGCCLPGGGGAAFCTDSRDSCANGGGIFVGCQSFDQSTNSVCCWNDSASPGSELLLASTCGTRPTSCKEAADCNSGVCQLATCGGVIVGACDVTPTCP